MRNKKFFQVSTISITVFWLIIFFFIPNLIIFITSFLTYDPDNFINFQFTIENYLKLLGGAYGVIYYNSIKIGLITTFFCLILGYPFAYIISHIKSKIIKNICLALTIIPFWTSSLIRTYAIIAILRMNGLANKFLLSIGLINEPLNLIYNDFSIIFGLVYTLMPFMILPIYIAIEKIEDIHIEAALDLGASKLKTFLKVIIPMSYNGIVSGSIFVFLSSFGMFYISDILGGAKNLMIGNLVKNQFLITRNWPFGSAICITLFLLMGFLILLINKYKKTNITV